ncbi:hypothetical protein ACSTS3_18650 [Aquimarina muelleri]|uniref:hypothetical protein n=1 Tax=Aquimarina muelleri TaxID=279356 RepID=UPI003F687631
MKKTLLLLTLILTLSCSKDDEGTEIINANLSYKLVYTTGLLPNSTLVRSGNTITYETDFEFKEVGYDEATRTVTVETKENPVKIESNFYIEDGSEVDIKLYNSNGNVVDEKTIAQTNYTYTYEF